MVVRFSALRFGAGRARTGTLTSQDQVEEPAAFEPRDTTIRNGVPARPIIHRAGR